MIHGAVCGRCGKWHSHVYPDPGCSWKNICINCLNKIRDVWIKREGK